MLTARIAIVAIALLVRVGTLALQGPTIPDGDAANYCRIAQNLHDGVGDVTIRDVPNVLHAPLYPLAMAGVMEAGASPERAGIIVSLLSGIAVVLLLVGITAAMAGEPAALVAGLLAAVHPMLVDASIVPLSESLFMALLLAGLGTLAAALRRPSVPLAVLVGLCFGCAYVTREEGLAFLPASAAVIIAWHAHRRTGWRAPAAQVAALLVAFALPAAPYVRFLSAATGHFALEAKSTTNYDLSAKLLAGATYPAAADAIDARLTDLGVEVGASYPFTGAPIHVPTLAERLLLGLRTAPHQLKNLYAVFFAKRNAMIVFTAFALAGAVWRLRGGRTGAIDVLLTYGLLTEFGALLTLDFYWPRFGYTIGALLVPWSACGIALSVAWLQGRRVLDARATSAALVGALGVIWCTTNVLELRRNAVDPAVFRDAGAWIAGHGPKGARVFSNEPVTAYYALGTLRLLPHTDAATALRYLRSRAPDYLVVSNVFTDEPYLPDWERRGVPEERPAFSETRGAERIRVYRFANGVER